MERNEMMLYGCNLDGIGLEIAPSHSPVLPKKSGYKIETLDCLDQVGLRQKYATHDVNLENIEEVDYVWNGGSYAETIGKIACYNYIIASHVIEHTVDIVGYLNDCAVLLQDDGILSLAIPDKRCCFDFFRQPTTIRNVLDSHYLVTKSMSGTLSAFDKLSKQNT